jgi:hypothetical protein
VNATKTMRLTPEQRASYYRLLVDMTGPCELWTGTIDKQGYGRAVSATGEQSHAHRVAWENAYGQLPADVLVRHKCDTKACVRLDHLIEGSTGQNSRDAVIRGGYRCGEAHSRAKLTENEVRAIRASTDSQRVLAARYGVTQACICKVRTGHAWAHVRKQA